MKKILLFTLVISAFTISSQINIGMISQYYFCGNANDVIGPNNGIVRGATLVPDRFGNNNAAYCFNGTNNLINLGTTNSLKTTTMSISLWVKISSYSNTNVANPNQPFIATRSRNSAGSYEAYLMGLNISTSKLDAATTSTSGVQNGFISNVVGSINVWNHMVYMFRDDSTFLYINGAFQQKVYKGFISGYLAGDSVTLGYSGSGMSSYGFLNGCLDDIRIYNRLLSPSDITQLYNEANTNPTITASTSNTLICGPPYQQTCTLTANGANTYTWSPGGAGTNISVSPSVTTTYTVTGTALNGCSNTSIFTQSVSTCAGVAIISNPNAAIKIYPNPSANGVFKIDTKDILKIKISNLLGQVIYQDDIVSGTTELDLSNQNSGIYYIIIINGKRTESQKLIIEK